MGTRIGQTASRFDWAKALLLFLFSISFAVATANIGLWFLKMCDPPIYYHDPKYGYLAVPDQWPSTRGFFYRINRAGLRGPDFSMAREPGSLRITFVGDSVTFAGGIVSDTDTFVAQSARLLSTRLGRSISTVNISAPGWGVENMQAYIARYGVYNANLVVWVLPHEDLRRPWSYAPGMPARRVFRIQFLLSHTINVLKSKVLNRNDQAGGHPPDLDQVLEDNLHAFGHALDLIRNSGAKTVIVFLPEGDTPASADKQAYEAYAALAASRGVPTCDLCSQMEAHGGSALFYDGAHLNSHGHDVVAPLIAQCVARLDSDWLDATPTGH